MAITVESQAMTLMTVSHAVFVAIVTLRKTVKFKAGYIVTVACRLRLNMNYKHADYFHYKERTSNLSRLYNQF